MKHLILAVVVLLCGAVGLASADYILITANINATTTPSVGPNGPGPMPGGSIPPSGSVPPGGSGPRPGGSGPSRRLQGPRPGGSGPMGFGPPPMPNQMGFGPMPNQMGAAPNDGPQNQILAVVEVAAPSVELSSELYKTAYDTNGRMPLPLRARDRWGIALLLNIKGMSPDVKFEAIKGPDAPSPTSWRRATP